MKRQDLLRHLGAQGCALFREGAKHTIYYNPDDNQTSAIPRHREIDEFLVRKICRDLGVPEPRAR
jgi:predicted RNA binding protein YcfA (HicA-like mRNA interferase family)